MSLELVEALRRQPEMIQTALTNAFVRHARVMTSLGQECDIVTKFMSALPNGRNSAETSPICDAIHRVPWERRCC